jgi:hypothetical protein
MNAEWKQKLVAATKELCSREYPIWWDGFMCVIVDGHSSCDEDNPYNVAETPAYEDYKAGAKAAESLLKSKA